MNNLIFCINYILSFVLGLIIALLLVKKPIQFVIHHKNENIYPPIPEETIPKMSDVVANKDPEEDQTYEEMGKLMDNVTEIFGGSDRK